MQLHAQVHLAAHGHFRIDLGGAVGQTLLESRIRVAQLRFTGAQVFLLQPQLVFHALHPGARLRHVAHHIEDVLVVVRDQLVAFAARAGKLRLQAAAVEQGQGQGRADEQGAAAGLQQLAQFDRIEAERGAQVDIGIERRLCRLDMAHGRLHSPAGSLQVGPARQQFHAQLAGQGVRQRLGCFRLQAGQG